MVDNGDKLKYGPAANDDGDGARRLANFILLARRDFYRRYTALSRMTVSAKLSPLERKMNWNRLNFEKDCVINFFSFILHADIKKKKDYR